MGYILNLQIQTEHLLKLGIVKHWVPKGPILSFFFDTLQDICQIISLQFRPVPFVLMLV
jgi:hypothetical protein